MNGCVARFVVSFTVVILVLGTPVLGAGELTMLDATAQAQNQIPEPPPVVDVSDPGVVYTKLSAGVNAWRATLDGPTDQWGNAMTSCYVSALRPDFVPASLQAFLLQYYAGSSEVALGMGPGGVASTTLALQQDWQQAVDALANQLYEQAAAANQSENVPDLGATDDDGNGSADDETSGDETGGTDESNGGSVDVATVEGTPPGPNATRDELEAYYHIHIEDAGASWSTEQLACLQDVLEKLPASFWGPLPRLEPYDDELVIRRVVRTGEKGADGSEAIGLFDACEPPEKILIGDGCWEPWDGFPAPAFSMEESRIYSFAGTIAHELTHRRLATNDEGEYYPGLGEHPLEKDWIEKFGWQADGKGGWACRTPNLCVTEYATTNPEEDMCESVMMYLYYPAKMRSVCPEKYAWIRDVLKVAESGDPHPLV